MKKKDVNPTINSLRTSLGFSQAGSRCDTPRMHNDISHLLMVMAVCLVMQLPPLLFGIELTDMGFYMTFYRYFFQAPDSVSYNFMFWLSGLIGGTWMQLFGDSLLAMRILGLLCNTASALILFSIFGHRYHKETICAIICVLAANMAEPLTFNYNTCSVLFALAGLAFMLNGLRSCPKRRRLVRICIGGFIIGINTLSRISNIVGILFILLIPIAHLYQKYSATDKIPPESRNRWWRESIWWLCAWISGILLDFAIMALLGQTSAFIHGMEMLLNVGASGNAEASHSMGNLLTALLISWTKILKVSVMLAIPYVIALAARFFTHNRWLRYSLRLLAIICVMIIIYRAPNTSSFLGGVSVAGTLALLLTQRNDINLSMAAWAGLAAMILLPAGSDYGIINMGSILFWIPLCSAFIFSDDAWRWRYHSYSSGKYSSPVITLIFTTCMIYSIVTGGVYFDRTPLREMNHSVNSAVAHGVLTSHERSIVINRILAGMDSTVNSDEPIVIYGAAPSLYWMSGTKPISALIWPEQLSASNLHSVLDTLSIRPKVIILKFNTVGDSFGIPSPEYAHGDTGNDAYHTKSKSNEIFHFIDTHDYLLKSDDPYYYFYVPRQ